MPTVIATRYEPVIGIEVHCQLATQTKMFCRCRVAFGATANSLTCPVCLGLPGALPVTNKRAIEFGIRVGLALNCKIARRTKFDRKNYFYPDLPKGYQISQYDQPLNYDGMVELPLKNTETGLPIRVGITRAHMEEDAGKNIHMDGFSLVDLNRAGTPLVEIVSEPDMHSPEEAYAYMTTLKRNLSYLDVSPLSMEKGSLRCDLNISLRPMGEKGLPKYKVEVKNLNSFHNAKAALEFEIKRQTAALESGERIPSETRLWDDAVGETRLMRTKEGAADYRYFPEPDLPPLMIDEAWIKEIRSSLPEMPDSRLVRFLEEYAIKREDAEAIVDTREVADFFVASVKLLNEPQKIANWISGEIGRALNDRKIHFRELNLKPEQLAGLIHLLDEGKINNITAKEVFADMIDKGGAPLDVAKRLNKLIETDDGAVNQVIDEVLKEFDKAAADLKSGKEAALGFLVGQCMRKLKGKGNPKDLGKRIAERINK